MKRPQLSLRDLFWLMLVAGVGVGWYMGRVQKAKELDELAERSSFFGPLIRSSPSNESIARAAALESLPKLTDVQMSKRLRELRERFHFDRPEYEPCLLEMVRRGLHEDLQKHYDHLMAREQTLELAPTFDISFFHNRELLVALRRSQGKNDPLKIHLELDSGVSKYNPNSAPHIRVTMENVDAGKESVYFVNGDDNWQIEMTDELGKRVPDSNFQPSPFGYIATGFVSMGPLAFGEKERYAQSLDAREYVKPPRPGKYRLQVFHYGGSIAREPNREGLIVLKSEPIDVIVEWPLGEAWDYSMFPPIAVLSAVGAACVWLGVRFLRSIWRRSGHISFVRRKDLAWLALVIILAAGWLVDNRYQTREIQRLTPDAEANWTMRLAE